MCVIIHLMPGHMIEKEKLLNAAANNWHSWGIVIRKNGDLQIIKKVPKNAHLNESDENAGGCHEDVDEIFDILEDNIDHNRYLHLRHATGGDVDEDNCHPFEVYKDKKRTVLLFHNGHFNSVGVANTSFGRGSSWQGHNTYNQYREEQEKNKRSDTVAFIEDYLRRPLSKFVKGDYMDEDFQKHVWGPMFKDKGSNSRVLIISNDLPDMYAGTWHDYVNTETKELAFKASNQSYFNRIERGPMFQKEERERKLREFKERQEREGNEKDKAQGASGQSADKKDVKEVLLTKYEDSIFRPDPRIIQGIRDFFERFVDELTPEEISKLHYLSRKEWEIGIETMITVDSDCHIQFASAIEYLIDQYAMLYRDHEVLKKARKVQEQPKLTVVGGADVG